MQIFKQLLLVIQSFFLSIMPTTQYIEGITGQPQSFLPHQAVTQNDVTISKLIYKGLFNYDIYGSLIPDLAESWSVSEDGLVYTVTLKPNQYWTDGTLITSEDVIYTAFKHPSLQQVGTDQVDERTVRFYLPNKFSPFLSMLTNSVMKADSEENYDKLIPASNGRFRVLKVNRSGPVIKEVVLLNNDESQPIKKLVFRYYSNEDELVTAVKLGEIDGFMADKKHDDLENLTNHRFPVQDVYYALFMNVENEKLSDLVTREKLAKVINIDNLIYDKGISVEGPISRSVFTNPDLDYDLYDPEFKEDLELNLTLVIPDLKVHEEIATVIKQIWHERLDVNLDIEKRDPKTFLETTIIPRNYEIVLYGQEVGRDPGRYVNWHSTQKEYPGLNLSKFEHIRSDRALEEGRNAVDNVERQKHYDEFQKVIMEQVPAIFLYHPYKNYYVSNYITGVGEKYTYTLGDRFLDFNNWNRVVTN